MIDIFLPPAYNPFFSECPECSDVVQLCNLYLSPICLRRKKRDVKQEFPTNVIFILALFIKSFLNVLYEDICYQLVIQSAIKSRRWKTEVLNSALVRVGFELDTLQLV